MLSANINGFQSAPVPRDVAATRSVEVSTRPRADSPVTTDGAVEAVTSAEVQTAVDNLNKFLSPVVTNILFTTDKDAGKIVVKVVDKDSNKVIRQMPSEEALRVSKYLDSVKGYGSLKGLLFSQSA